MSVSEEVADQMRQAMKDGEKERLRVLRMLRSEFQVAETSGRDFDELDVVKSYAKKLRESAEEFDELGREDRAAAARRDLAVVEEFLPPQMSEEEIEELVSDIIEENEYGLRDVGKVMKTVMGEHGDVVDGRVAQRVARRLLEQRD